MHYNPAMPHQVNFARAFAAGGFEAVTDPKRPADVHVVMGPYYALPHWQAHPRVLLADRAWWGDPGSVSLGWLQPDGSRKFATGTARRPHPRPRPWKQREESALVLADYGQDGRAIANRARQRFHCVRLRQHPAVAPGQVSLSAHLALCDTAIGTAGTALFEALISGLPAICLDPRNPCAEVCVASMDEPLRRPGRAAWLHAMSYRQFTLQEIADGTAWELLRDVE